KNYLTTVLNSMNDAVLVTSPEGLVRQVNEAAIRLFGYSEDDIKSRAFLDLIAPNERAAFSMQPPTETRETVIATRSGQTIPVSLSSAPIGVQDPQCQRTIFLMRSITER